MCQAGQRDCILSDWRVTGLVDDKITEQADWIGRTGLGEEIERELPRYLRQEFGKSMQDDDALTAADLTYLGAFAVSEVDLQEEFSEYTTLVHCWIIPGDSELYAYAELFQDGRVYLGIGGYLPEAAQGKSQPDRPLSSA